MRIALLAATTVALIFASSVGIAANAHATADQSGMQAMSMPKTETFDWGHPGKVSEVDRVIHIKAEDSMHFVPDKLTVKSGSTLKFVITNTGKLEHELVLGPVAEQKEHEEEMQAMMQSGEMHMMHSDPNEVELKPGTTKTLIWTFTKAGTLLYGCHMSGHYTRGMFGTITVVKK